MKISLIVAMAKNRTIGLNGRMPWHLSADLKRFRHITMGSPIIMGRKTFEAIGKPLPGRLNIVVSRNGNFHHPSCLVFSDIEKALQHCADSPELFVIGGATLYQALLPRADFLYLTLIDKDFAGDTFFPPFDRERWQALSCEQIDDDPCVDFSYSFQKLEAIKPPLQPR